MDREQAYNQFWNSFDIPAYDTNTVPQDAPLPRITYDVAISDFDTPTSLMASIWLRSTGWKEITAIARRIENKLSEGGQMVSYDDGAIWIKKGYPFLQRMSDPDDTIRRIVVIVEVEYLEGKR